MKEEDYINTHKLVSIIFAALVIAAIFTILTTI